MSKSYKRKAHINHKEKKYTSIVLIPNSTGKVKTIRIYSLYSKIASLALFLVTIIACSIVIAGHTVKENRKLLASKQVLESIVVQQKDLLNEKAEQIIALQEFENNVRKDVQRFIQEYTQITEKYITDRLEGSTISRYGSRSDIEFIEDINGLKIILDNLSKIKEGVNVTSSLEETEQKLRKYIDSMPTLWPVSGRISSGYGERKDPFTNRKSFHEGIDIAADYGQEIKAAGSGKVIFAGWDNLYGRTVIIDHGYGIKTLYGHTSKIAVNVNQEVKKGDLIAYVGSSGRSTGAHLHFEVHLNGTPVNPLDYLERD